MKYLKYLFDNVINNIESSKDLDIDYTELLNIKASGEIIYYFVEMLDNIITKNTEIMLKKN